MRIQIRQKLALAGIIVFWAQSSIYATDQVTISYSSRSCAFLPAQVAVARGFFKDENLEPLLIQMHSQVAVPALMRAQCKSHPRAPF
jgi:ABC-type nitrate/sulfonate/bicarbonate transport system substrate-binding protein